MTTVSFSETYTVCGPTIDLRLTKPSVSLMLAVQKMHKAGKKPRQIAKELHLTKRKVMWYIKH